MDAAPGLNNLGQVAYGGSFNYIWLYDQRDGSNVAVSSNGGKSVQINDSGLIAWYKGRAISSITSLYLASPITFIAPVNSLLLSN